MVKRFPLPFFLTCLLLISARAAELSYDLEKVLSAHLIKNGKYLGTGQIRGVLQEAVNLTVRAAHAGQFAFPVFESRGAGILAIPAGDEMRPELLSKRGGSLCFRIEPAAPLTETYRIGTDPPDQVAKKVELLLKKAGVKQAQKIASLETDADRRRFLVLIHVLALNRDRDVPVALSQPPVPRSFGNDKNLSRHLADLVSSLSNWARKNGAVLKERELKAVSQKYVVGDLQRKTIVNYVRKQILLALCRETKKRNRLLISYRAKDSAELLEESLHRAKLVERLAEKDSSLRPQTFSNMPVRRLRDQLVLQVLRAHIKMVGLPVAFPSEELIVAALRSVGRSDPSLGSVLSSKGKNALGDREVNRWLRELGLDKRMSRASASKRRDVLYQAVAWRAALFALRKSYLDLARVRAYVVNRVGKGKPGAKPGPDQPGKPLNPAARKLHKKIMAEQERHIRTGLLKSDFKRFYKPFPVSAELRRRYAFLSKKEVKAVRSSLATVGLNRTFLARQTPRDLVKLHRALRTILKAPGPGAAEDETVSAYLPGLARALKLQERYPDTDLTQAAEVLALLWKSFRQYSVRITFEFQDEEKEDANGFWLRSSRLPRAVARSQRDARIELRGSLDPGRGDAADWWQIPRELVKRQWRLEGAADSVKLVRVPGDSGLYLNIKTAGKSPQNYLLTAGEKGASKLIRRYEQRESYRELDGPPF